MAKFGKNAPKRFKKNTIISQISRLTTKCEKLQYIENMWKDDLKLFSKKEIAKLTN